MGGYQKLFNKDGKMIEGKILVAGVKYMKVTIDSSHGCDHCDCQYNSNWCRVGGGNCNLNDNECYKVLDSSKRIQSNGIYEIGGKRYLAGGKHCKECAFYEITLNGVTRSCTLTGFSCAGHIPLKEISEGGV